MNLKNVTRAYINIGVSNSWVKYEFWVNYPFHNVKGQLLVMLAKSIRGEIKQRNLYIVKKT